MAFNFGFSTGGVSNPTAWNNNQINGFGVNFGQGGFSQGNLHTGDITSGQTTTSEGGHTKQDASAQFTIPVALMNLGSIGQTDYYYGDFYGNRFNLQNLESLGLRDFYGNRFNLQNLGSVGQRDFYGNRFNL